MDGNGECTQCEGFLCAFVVETSVEDELQLWQYKNCEATFLVPPHREYKTDCQFLPEFSEFYCSTIFTCLLVY